VYLPHLAWLEFPGALRRGKYLRAVEMGMGMEMETDMGTAKGQPQITHKSLKLVKSAEKR